MTATTGTVVDPRDSRVYRTVLMPDGKWWTVENLDWVGGTSYEVNNNIANRPKHGRLYNVPASPVHFTGTHVPSNPELLALWASVGGDSVAGLALRTSEYGGTDSYGFSWLCSGYRTEGEGFAGFDTVATFAVASVNYAYSLLGFDSAGGEGASAGGAFSVRLIVDSGNIPDTATAPRIYPASGTLQGVQLVVIQGQGTIRYTLDGSEPTASSPIYTGPFRLASSATVKAKAFQNSLESATATSTLVIQGADFLKIPSYTAHVLPYLLEQYKGDNP